MAKMNVAVEMLRTTSFKDGVRVKAYIRNILVISRESVCFSGFLLFIGSRAVGASRLREL
jgi:hypothetical protein